MQEKIICEKDKIQQCNEKIMKRCFSTTSAFCGIDSTTIRISGTFEFDHDILSRYLKTNNSKNNKCKISECGNYEFIQITSKEFGKLEIGQDFYRKHSSYYCHLQLIHPDVNTETISVNQLKSRVIKLLKIFESEMGILITPYKISLMKLELAFTFATNSIIHLQTRNLFIKCFSKASQVDKKIYEKASTKEDHHILSSRLRKNMEHVLYDKTAKAEHRRHIKRNSKRQFRVYRYETTLNEQKIKKEFGSALLEDLTDKQIIIFLEELLTSSIFRYIDLLRESIKITEQELCRLNREKGKDDYIDAFLSRQLNNSLEKLSPLTIDEGIFCFLDTTSFISTSNSARTKRNLIKQSRKRDSNESTYFLSKMISWQVLHLFKLFYDSLEFAKVLGLGCFINETCTEIHLLKQKEFTTDQRDIVFNQIIRSKKKNNKIDLNKIIINQLNDLDSELF